MSLIYYPNKILTTKCRIVEPEELTKLKEIAHEMRTIIWNQDGLGLAAPQVGKSIQFLLIRTIKDDIVTFVNPIITEEAPDTIKTVEGCLSLPGVEAAIKRTPWIEVLAQDMDGALFRTKLYNRDAIIFAHECLRAQSIIKTEDGEIPISKIVNNQLDCKVLSFGSNGLEYKKVIGWKRKARHKQQWYRIKLSETGPHKQLVCTGNHPCAILSDPLQYNINNLIYTPAKDLTDKYIIRLPKSTGTPQPSFYNQEQMSLIIGSLLGDASIGKHGDFICNHGEPQKEYAEWKASFLNGITKPAYSGFRDEFSNIGISGPVTEQTKKLRELCYTPKKTPLPILHLIDHKALAVWYMDDGCIIHNRYAQIHTEGFSKQDVQKLSNHINITFGFYSKPVKRTFPSGKTGYMIYFGKHSGTFFEKIAKYIHQSMQYKLPVNYRNKPFLWNKISRENISCRQVKEVRPIFYESALYDIQVEDNHNFFADDTLVHNCDHLQGKTLFESMSKSARIFKKNSYLKKMRRK